MLPNTSFQQRLAKRVIDLYVAQHDAQVNRYTRIFYGFTVTDEVSFEELQKKQREREEVRAFNAEKRFSTVVDEFASAIIMECRY